MFGFMNINKPKGMTSFDVVAILRKITGVKKIGHAGTLDPSAEGVLPIAVGNATKLIDYLSKEKVYLANFKLGFKSVSFDCDTELEKVSERVVTKDELEAVLKDFTGEIIQKPPIFSAVKVNGKRLYEYARKGNNVDIPSRTVIVESIEPKDFNGKEGAFFIKCSKGTYIRSIINDIGEKLGTGAVMTGLTRLKSGGMSIEESVLPNFSENTDIKNFIIPPQNILKYLCIELSEAEYEKVKHGNSLTVNEDDGFCFLTYRNETVAFARIINNTAKINNVFCEQTVKL